MRKLLVVFLVIFVLAFAVTAVTAREVEDLPPTQTPAERLVRSANNRGADLLPAPTPARGASDPNESSVRPGEDPGHAYLFPCLRADRPGCTPGETP